MGLLNQQKDDLSAKESHRPKYFTKPYTQKMVTLIITNAPAPNSVLLTSLNGQITLKVLNLLSNVPQTTKTLIRFGQLNFSRRFFLSFC